MQKDRGKEFLNKTFEDTLKREGIQFHVCRKHDVKCVVIERTNLTLRDKLYIYFTYKNMHRYIDVLPQFVNAYNNTALGSTGLASAAVTDSQVLEITDSDE